MKSAGYLLAFAEKLISHYSEFREGFSINQYDRTIQRLDRLFRFVTSFLDSENFFKKPSAAPVKV